MIIDLKNCDIFLRTTLPIDNITVRVGEGNLTFSEKRNLEYTLNKGELDEVRQGDEVALSFSLQIVWDYIKSASGHDYDSPVQIFRTIKEGCSPLINATMIIRADECKRTEDIIFNNISITEISYDPKGALISVTGSCLSDCVENHIAGVDWVTTETLAGSGWKKVIYGNGRFYAFNDTHIAYSVDGIDWTIVDVSALFTGPSIKDVAAGDNMLMVIDGEENIYSVGYTVDPSEWTNQHFQDMNWERVSYNPVSNRFCVLNSKVGITQYYMVFTLGNILTDGELPVDITPVKELITYKDRFIAVRNGIEQNVINLDGTVSIFESPSVPWTNGVMCRGNLVLARWEYFGPPPSQYAVFTGISNPLSRMFFSSHSSGTNDLCYGGGLLVVALSSAIAGSYLLVSEDCINYAGVQSPSITEVFLSLAYGNGLFVGIAGNGKIIKS